jgi:O-antigen ligase
MVDACSRVLSEVSSSRLLSVVLFQNRKIFSGAALLVGILMLGGIVLTQVCLGGTRPALAYPGFLLVACAGLASISLIGAKRNAPGWGLLVWTGIFFGYLIVRGLFSPLTFLATANALLILSALIAYTLSAAIFTSPRSRFWLIGGFICLEAGHLWLGLTQSIFGNKWLVFDYVRPDYGSRASGFYTCPNHLAGFLETLALLLLAIGLFGRLTTWLRIVFLYFAGAAFAGVLITGSRGGYVSTATGLTVVAGYGVYHLIQVKRIRLSLLLLGASCTCTAVWLGFSLVAHNDLVSGRLDAIAEPQDIRPHLWQAGIRAFTLDPVVGTGAGTYLVYGRQFRDAAVQTDPVYTHNDYLQLLAEYGLMGGALVICFLAAHFLAAWKYVRWRMRKLEKMEEAVSSSLALVIGAAAGIAAIAVHSFFDFNLQVPGNTLFVAFLFGVLANPGVAWQENRPIRSGWVWKSVPAVLGITLIGLMVPRWSGESETEASRRTFLNGAYALTISHAMRAAESGSENPDLFYYLGESRRLLANQFDDVVRLNFLKSAAEAFDHGLEYFPMDERSLVKCGLTRAELGDFEKADTYFTQALKWDPNLGQIYAFYGARLQLEGRDQDAMAAYQRSNELSVNPLAIGGIQQLLRAAKVKRSASAAAE